MNGSRGTAVVCATVVTSLTAATALAVPPPPDGKFAGKTNQTKAKNRKVTLKTDANSHVSKVSIAWRAKCNRKGFAWKDSTAIDGGSDGLAMKGDVFQRSGSYTAPGGKGISGLVKAAFSGQFTDEDHANGLFTVRVTVKKRGEVIDRCRASKVKWSVARVP